MGSVKLIANQNLLERIVSGKTNLERYQTFVDIFGRKNFQIVLIGDLIKEVQGKERCQSYLLGKSLQPIPSEGGISCDLVIASGFNTNTPPKREDINQIMSYLEKKKEEGIIGELINSKKSSLFEDKKSILEIESWGFPCPTTFHSKDLRKIKQFISRGGDYILKHRFGFDGEGIKRIHGKYYPHLELDAEDYIVQGELPIESEIRLIFFDGEFLGARKITDRTRPWEIRGTVNRKHLNQGYLPTIKEIKDSKEIMVRTDTCLGCVDWIYTPWGERYFLELNGAGTGLGRKGTPYNLNALVANKIKEKYL